MTADLPEPHALARRTDPDTSHAAAHQLGDNRATLARQLLYVFSICPLTADEASDAIGDTAYKAGTWKRISDLVNAGLVENTDTRRPGRSGRLQVVRRITPAGRDALRSSITRNL